jgi:hypothetical protein
MRSSLRQSRLFRAAGLAAPVLLIAGCAGGLSGYVSNPANGAFSLVSSAHQITTNGQVQLKAVTASGAAAAVKWTLVQGENDSAIGQGSVDASGLYIPPASLSRDSIEVEIQAQLRSDPTKTATEVVAITPGFLQPLTPENSSLAAGESLPITAQLAEVGGGTVDWSLSTAQTGGRRLGSSYGSFSEQACQHSPRNYTICSAVYTAPAALPVNARDAWVIAMVHDANGGAATQQSAHLLLGPQGFSSTPLTNQLSQSSLVQLGASGGNNNDADLIQGRAGQSLISDCCGGTLGALVRDQTGSQYILSNNHVLAESDQASVGDTIVHPALIDQNCDQNAGRPVAALRYVVPLGTSQTNVDAALAEVDTGSVDPSGAILQLGEPGGGANGAVAAAAPAAGLGEAISPALFAPGSPELRVAKSGRTTGLTCSTIDAIGLSIEVDYYKDCAETQHYYRKTFTNQIGIGGAGFSDSGDSGALVVDAANAEPLGLFFAGGTDDHGGGFSVASPIQDVLGELGAEAGRQFSIVGGAEHPVSCLNYDASRASSLASLSDALRRKAEAAVRRSAAALVDPSAGILELAAGVSADAPGEPAVIVYVDRNKESVAVPQTVAGLRTVVVATDEASLNAGTAPKSPALTSGIHLPEAVLTSAAAVQQAYARRLMADPAIFGVGVTQSRDNPAEASLLVLVDLSRTPRSTPAVVGGLRTRYLALNRFHVTRSKYAGAPHPSSCELKSRPTAGNSTDFDPDRQTLPMP